MSFAVSPLTQVWPEVASSREHSPPATAGGDFPLGVRTLDTRMSWCDPTRPRSVLAINLDGCGGLLAALRALLAQQTSPAIRLEECSTGDYPAALARSKPGVVCLVVTDSRVSDVCRTIRQLREQAPNSPCVVVSCEHPPQAIYEFLEAGAADFIAPPLCDYQVLPRLWRHLQSNPHADHADTGALAEFGLIGASPEFREITLRLPQIAACGASVMISGETGTGKEVVARAIHRLSSRAGRPFVPVNCGAIPVDLVENELFGHQRGAYTGAGDSREGLIAESEGGTLFLDEIDSLPLLAQVKLLRFLQEKEYRSLGSAKTFRADVRVITATNVDVERAVHQGKLRQDLYYRVNVVPVTLPPLRQRVGDIPVLAGYFVAKYCALFGKPVATLTPAAQQKLILHPWPGNVRELEHVLERAVALAPRGVLDVADLALPGEKEVACSFRQAKARVVQQFEHVYLESLLVACGGNISHAAVAAQKDRRAFWELLRKHRIDAGSFKSLREAATA